MKDKIFDWLTTFIGLLLSIFLWLTVYRVFSQRDRAVYAKTAVVTAVDYEADVVVCEDYNGFTWEFSNTEDWCVGDCVSLVMDDNGTREIFDDTIESVRYSGWTVSR